MGGCLACLRDPSSLASQVELNEKETRPHIGIPDDFRGPNVKVDTGESLCITGDGVALASAPIEQDAAYWEIHVTKTGLIKVGVARKMNRGELDRTFDASAKDENGHSWCLDGTDTRANLEDGDVVGVAFTQADLPNLSFTKNGKAINFADVKKIPGTVYPVVMIGGGASIEAVFDPEKMNNQPPPTFKPLMVVRSIL